MRRCIHIKNWMSFKCFDAKPEYYLLFNIYFVVVIFFALFKQSSMESGTSSPLAYGPPEYMIGTYRPGDYEYVGVPLDHSQTEEESSGPSTAEIIANQSQDYVDEKLAEYQATIQQLQSEYYFFTYTYPLLRTG